MDSLPANVIDAISQFTDANDLLSFINASRQTRAMAEGDAFWRSLYASNGIRFSLQPSVAAYAADYTHKVLMKDFADGFTLTIVGEDAEELSGYVFRLFNEPYTANDVADEIRMVKSGTFRESTYASVSVGSRVFDSDDYDEVSKIISYAVGHKMRVRVSRRSIYYVNYAPSRGRGGRRGMRST